MKKLARDLLQLCRVHKTWVATVESCTGGRVAHALTEIAGCSDHFFGGWVTYNNSAKQNWVGVAAATLKAHGAVSPETAAEMARGAQAKIRQLLPRECSILVIATTGIAGPGGGSKGKPVGLCYVAVAWGKRRVVRRILSGRGKSRTQNKRYFAEEALKVAVEVLK